MILLNKGTRSGNLELNQNKPSATEVRNGWWPHAVETRGKDCRPNRELPLQVLHGGSRTGLYNHENPWYIFNPWYLICND